jgi:hypothetical protein
MKKEIVYHYRGLIERLYVRGRGCRGRNVRGAWIEAYSENSGDGGVMYPWMGKRQCQAEARERGCVARFERCIP